MSPAREPPIEMPIATPVGELMRFAELHPSLSLLQVIEMLDRDKWHIETPTPAQCEIYSRINARTALRRLRLSLHDSQADYPLAAPPRTQQWLATGRHLCVGGLLGPDTLKRLESQCDALLGVPGTPPIRVFDDPHPVGEPLIRSIAAAVLAALPDPLPSTSRPAVLKRRTILRRTFPPGRLPAQFGNANNQFWHQDSNAQFNDAPMLTLWIPLQDGAGVTRPGLQIIDAPVACFSVIHGDSSREIAVLLATMFPGTRTVSPQVRAGECVALNGLTFHQTWAAADMTDHRDALLIRVIDENAAHQFQVGDPRKELLSLA